MTGDRFFPASWSDCEEHDQNGDDPDIAPCINCGLLIEYIPEDQRQDLDEPIWIPAIYVIEEEELL